MFELEPIEPFLRQEELLDDIIVVLRGGPIAAAKIVEHALLEARAHSFQGKPIHSVSVSMTIDDWTLDDVRAAEPFQVLPLPTVPKPSQRSTRAEAPTGREPRTSPTIEHSEHTECRTGVPQAEQSFDVSAVGKATDGHSTALWSVR